MPYKDKEKQREAQRKYERGKRKPRHGVWTFIFYPEDNGEWAEVLDDLAIEVLVSPEHDNDRWTERDERKNPKHKAGEKKKNHRHGLVRYPNPVDYDKVMEDFAELGIHTVKYVRSYSAMALYLTHAKSPEKTQYDPKDVVEFGGASYNEAINEGIDLHAELKAMRAFIRENNFTEFYDFWNWCDENRDDWSYLIDVKCAWVIGQYIDRYRNALAFDAREREAEPMPEQEITCEVCGAQKPASEFVIYQDGRGKCRDCVAGLTATPARGGAEPRTLNPDKGAC